MNKKFLRWGVSAFALAAVIAVGATYTTNIPFAQAEEAKPAAAAPVEANKDAPKDAAPVVTIKDAVKPETVYATIGTDKLLGKEVLEFFAKLPPQLQGAPADQILPLLVNQLVNDRLLDKAIVDTKMDQDADVLAAIKEASKQIAREQYIKKNVADKINDTNIKAKYDELLKKIPAADEVRARHILVADEKVANEVLGKLAKGEDFAALAKQYSKDPTKDNGGDLGYFVKDAMVKEFGDAAFGMKVGEVSKTAVKTQFGYHILKVEDKRKQPAPDFDQVKDRVRNQVIEDNVRKMIDELRAKSSVKIDLPAAKTENTAEKK
jgi:peptidyl-prolyl cis-trans isomerase C